VHASFSDAVPATKEAAVKAAPLRQSSPPPPPAAKRFNATQAAAWVGLLLFVAGLIWATVTYRQAISEAWPQSSSLYDAIGMPVNVRGLDIQEVDYKQEFEDVQPVLVISGKVVNMTNRELSVPLVRIGLSDAAQRELESWTADIGTPTLGPGEARSFVSRYPNPPVDSHTVDVRFVRAGEAP
jgi:hypothetical protein